MGNANYLYYLTICVIRFLILSLNTTSHIYAELKFIA
jgi:hypothetical protein